MAWPVYENYEIQEQAQDDGEMMGRVVAPCPPSKRRLIRNNDERQTYYHRWEEQDDGVAWWYAPLRRPDLLLRLAELGESGSLTVDEMLDWAREFGLLGVDDDEGRSESLFEFAFAAERVARTLRLYEAADAPGGPDTKALERFGIEGRTAHHLREAALDHVLENVAYHLEDRTYPLPYRSVLKETGETVGFAEGPGFRSLLGAIYIQMWWLMKQGNTVRRCQRKGCTKTITFEVPEHSEVPPINQRTGKPYKRGPYRPRTDKTFCSQACKRNWRYHNVEKPKRAGG